MNIKEELLEIISYQTAVTKHTITSSQSWKEAGIDSLDTLEVMLTVAEKFGVTIEEEDEEKLVNFNELLLYLEGKISDKY
jgi:acyl carrier protein